MVVTSFPAVAQYAGTRYAAAYTLTCFRLRAAYVCPGDSKVRWFRLSEQPAAVP